MKAARFYGPGVPLKVEDVPVPEVGRNDVLIQVKACGVCYSDVHKLHGSVILKRTPVTLGHEISGEIAEAGTEVKGFRKGDRVAVCCMVPCGSCQHCLARNIGNSSDNYSRGLPSSVSLNCRYQSIKLHLASSGGIKSINASPLKDAVRKSLDAPGLLTAERIRLI